MSVELKHPVYKKADEFVLKNIRTAPTKVNKHPVKVQTFEMIDELETEYVIGPHREAQRHVKGLASLEAIASRKI